MWNSTVIQNLLNIFIQALFAFLGAFSFGIYFQIRKRNLIIAALGGALSWLLLAFSRLWITRCFLPLPLYVLSIPYLIAAAGVSLYSEIMAILRKAPVSIFLIVSLIPLLPGARIFNSMVHFIHGRYGECTDNVLSSIIIAGSVSLSVLFTSFIFQMRRRLLSIKYLSRLPLSARK